VKRLLIPTALILLAGCDQTSGPDDLAFVAPSQALCRPTPNGRDVTGCYVTLTASRNDRLISVSSPVATEAQIHEMKVEGGIMKMAERKEGLPLPAGEAVMLKPGGDHIMLIGLKQPLTAGKTVSLTLTFEHAQAIGIRAAVGQPGQDRMVH